MADPLDQLIPGRPIAVTLISDGRAGSTSAEDGVRARRSAATALRGVVISVAGGWLQLLCEHGTLLINLAQVATILCNPAEPPEQAPVDAERPRPVSKDVLIASKGRAPGRPWRDEDLKALADGYLEGLPDAELSARFHRTRGTIAELRQGFECARGNLVEEQIGTVARTWVQRWRRCLTARP